MSSIEARIPESAADRLIGTMLPAVELRSSWGTSWQSRHRLGSDLTAIFFMPGVNLTPEAAWLAGWKEISGAAGCTAECNLLNEHGPDMAKGHVYPLVVTGQTQAEVARVMTERGYTFPIIADDEAEFLSKLGIEQFEYHGRRYHPRFVLILDRDLKIIQVLHEFGKPEDLVEQVRAL